MKTELFVGWLLVLGLLGSCATYDPATDYRSRLTPFAGEPSVRPLLAGDYGVPEVLVPSEPLPRLSGPVAEQAEALMQWMGERVTFDGSVMPPFPLTAPVLWERGTKGHALNCLAASTLFASLARGVGLNTRILWLYARDLSNENHVVVLLWDPGRTSWLVADPSYRTLFYDASGEPLGPIQLRDAVASGTSPRLSAGAGWNTEPVDETYLHYLSKNLYRWSTMGANGGRINLSPPEYFAFGPPWAFASVVHNSVEFLTPP